MCDILNEFTSFFLKLCQNQKDCSVVLQKSILSNECLAYLQENKNVYVSVELECQC